MVSDLVLKDDEVHINGFRLVVNGADLIIDAGADRRGENMSGYRRAIVHGLDDTLVINWNNDYTNGVTIQSSVRVKGDLQSDEMKVNTIKLGDHILAQKDINWITLGDEALVNPIVVRGRGIQIDRGLHVGEDSQFDEPIKTPDIIIISLGEEMVSPPYSLLNRITALETRVEALENP